MRKRQNTDDFIKLVFKNRNTVNKDLQNYSNSLFFNNESGKVYSYQEEIAEVNEFGEVYLKDKTSRGGWYFSRTTSSQVYKIERFLIEHEIPHEVENFK
jgi:virulence-associated protein VapD